MVLPSNVQTGFLCSNAGHASSNESDHDLRRTNRAANGKKNRAKTANARGRSRTLKTGKVFKDGSKDNPSHVVMNQRHMSVANGATSVGIVSLYNKGFVPKKTGKVNKKSKLAVTSKTLYNTEKEKQEAAEVAS